MPPFTRAEMDKLHPELEALFAKVGPPPALPSPTRATVPRFRQGFLKSRQRYLKSQLVQSTLPNPPTWTEHDIEIPVRDGTSIPTRVYLPQTTTKPLAAVVFFHGGGWFMGDLDTETHDCQVICSRLGVAVFNVAYCLYPEVDFPVPIYDAYDSVKYIAHHHSELGNIDLSRGFIVAGSSGGGTYASIVCHLARDDGLSPPLTGCHLACPILSEELWAAEGTSRGRIFGPERYASMDTHANAPLMDDRMRKGIEELMTVPTGKSVLLTPFHDDDHKDLPPTCVQVTGLDPWRDGGMIYVEELEKVGGRTRLDVFPGLPHCWWTTFPVLKVSRTRFENLVEGMRWLLDGAGKAGKL